MTNKASIIAIGTEVTSGEIMNRNGAWLAEKLQPHGIETLIHMAVPDERQLMTSAMDYASAHTDLVFITGGLGPTSDDFTREVVAEWVGQPLYFSEPVWGKLVETYEQRGLKIREAHKRQCYFPESCRLLSNTVGTAHGFISEKDDKRIFVLPGPPKEIEGMWKESIVDEIKALHLKLASELRVWRCFGVPESEVAEVVEKELEGSGFNIGYRASVPYVLVKVWFPVGQDCSQWQQKLDKALAEWVVGEVKKDLSYLWLEKVRGYDQIIVVDEATGGRLGARLHEVFQQREIDYKDVAKKLSLVTHFRSEAPSPRPPASDSSITFGITSSKDSQSYSIWTKGPEGSKSEDFEVPLRLFSSSEKAQVYMTEHAFQVWTRSL